MVEPVFRPGGAVERSRTDVGPVGGVAVGRDDEFPPVLEPDRHPVEERAAQNVLPDARRHGVESHGVEDIPRRHGAAVLVARESFGSRVEEPREAFAQQSLRLPGLPGVVVEGAVWAGDGCRIGPNCYLRGCVSLGNGCVVGQGVELKNCIIGDGTFIPHLSYAGDSIIGSDVNFGAGTVCSNFRHDGGEHRMVAGGKLEFTGRNKLGAVIGDHVRLGANTVVLPGRVLPPGAWTRPGEVFTGA
mgnify:CR=1 FL=1